MIRLTQADRERAIAAAAAHELNEELTIILCSGRAALAAMPYEHIETRRYLRLIEEAVHRCTGKTRGLLSYSAEKGVRAEYGSMESKMHPAGGNNLEPSACQP